MILSAEHQEIKSMAQKFTQKEVAPLGTQIDREECIPTSLVKQLADNGFFGIFIPENYGGAGFDYVSYALITAELSQGCASTGVLISAHNSLCVWPILHFGNENQKKTYLPLLASGEKIGCFCLSEPNAGSDAGSLKTVAVDKGSYFEISGLKNFITNGKEAGIAVVFAKTTNTPDYKGISTFIVDMKTPGIQVMKTEDKLGIKGSSTAQIAFDKVKVPKENLLGEYEKGFRIAMATLDGGRLGIASQALGIAQAAFSYAKKYSLERVQFGKPIAELQAIQFMLADMSTKIEASRLLILYASTLKDKKGNYTKYSAQAKLFASETAMEVTTKAIQVCGGNGYIREYPLERHFRDAKITEIYEGTSEIQRLVIAAQELKEL